MKLPLSLLLSFCDPGLEPDEIASVLALSGTEVERITHLGVADPSTFVVGEVLEAVQHPDADRLKVCTVDTGSGSPTTIVCGAPNVAAGQLVPVALPGSVMPNGMEIRTAKLRGVESNGMICAEDELGLGTGHEGILVLDARHGPPGRPLAEVLPLSEVVLELEITPNRPDCLGAYGVARELHAATGAPLAPAPWIGDRGSDGELEGFELSVAVPDLCPLFTARIYELPGAAVTPDRIASQLTAAGMRPISPVVDITNYVMLVVGEPLHAFDLDRIDGSSLEVRCATEGETLETLDGDDRSLVEGEIVICDATGPTSLAGVMGGARSEVSDATTRVLLEAAVWDGPTINRTSARLGLRSEASGRFEKGLSPVFATRGQAFASILFEEVFGVAPLAGTASAGRLSGTAAIELDPEQVRGLLGTSIDDSRIASVLEGLGFATTPTGDRLTVEVPPDRADVTRPVDLIEEVARIDGLDRIPASLPSSGGSAGRLTRDQAIRRKVEDLLAGAGCFGIAGWSFSSPELAGKLRLTSGDPRRNAVLLANPMSGEESQLRTTLLGSVLDSVARNTSRGEPNVRLFEVGPVYLPSGDGLADEPIRVACVLHGDSSPSWWAAGRPTPASVHTAAGVLGSVLGRLHCDWAIEPAAVGEPFLHPGRSGTVTVGGRPAGWIGDLHPRVADEWGLESASAFEIDLSAVISAVPEVVHFQPFSSLPAVSQDLAVVVPEGTAAGDLLAIARRVGGDDLEEVTVFDVYSGDQVADGRVSVGLRLVFRSSDRTLTEEDASSLREKILAALSDERDASAR